ncbi:MAG TPA: glycoside hydrolase family 172 protein [Polyangiaceae bacterium]
MIAACLFGGLLFVLWRSESAEPAAPSASSAGSPALTVLAVEAEVRPGEISAASLLLELIDLGRLATLPDPPYRAQMASSYDRRSVSQSDAAGWFANDDWASAERPNYLRAETKSDRTEYVLLDAKGPGAVVRIWSASPAGTLRIYLDGAERPEIEETFERLLSGTGSIPEPFAYVAARGYNSYFPIPFRRACKITADSLIATDTNGKPLPKLYYQIQYRSYPEARASVVQTLRRSDLERVAREARTARVFAEPWKAYEASPAALRRSFGESAGRWALELEHAGGGVVRELVVVARDTSDAGLRRARLRASFDGEPTIDAPLGDFFGAAPGLSPYDSLPFTVRDDGSFTCRFAMPFRERASFEIVNGPGVSAELVFEPDPWSERSLHFHARHRPTSSVASQPPSDLRMLALRGQGVYVGDAFNIENPIQRWWGEGDEKIYVDGEAFPSFFGTGTEDYYGYAWSATETFARALHAQPRTTGRDFWGRASNNRFRTLDAIPFERGFRFDLELWHWEKARVSWDAMTYFYARPGVTVEP